MARGVSTRRLLSSGVLTMETIMAEPLPAKGKTLLRCQRLRGFGVAITANGSRSYFVEARVSGHGGSAARKKIGKVGVMKHKEAVEEARKRLATMHLGNHPGKNEPDSVTLDDAFTDYFSARELRPTTRRDYEYARKDLSDWHTRALASITPTEVRGEFVRLKDLRSVTTASQHFRAFRAVWNYTFATMDNPPPSPTAVLSRSDLWPKLKRRRRVIGADVFPKWWRALDDLPGTWPTYFRLAALTGSRKGELLLLEWSRVTSKGNQIVFPDEHTKSKRELRLPLGPHAAKLLTDARKIERTHDEAERVFGSEVQHKRHVAALVKSLGVPWSAHDLRRMFISAGTRAGVAVPVVKSLVNHSLEMDVTDGYQNITEADRARAMQAIEREILKAARVKFTTKK